MKLLYSGKISKIGISVTFKSILVNSGIAVCLAKIVDSQLFSLGFMTSKLY